MDDVSENRLAQVHPVLSARIHALAVDIEPQAIIRITQGLRTWNEQDALYAQGRTQPGNIVTNAPGGYSAHNFGYAVDFVDMLGVLPDWNRLDSQWQEILEKAVNYGLAEGATWRTFPDFPHLYLKELPADPDDTMRYIFMEKGLSGVWADWNLPVPVAS
jgi:peptidoglycan L-alanyl-D-glutamate endopeptidase CwlK